MVLTVPMDHNIGFRLIQLRVQWHAWKESYFRFPLRRPYHRSVRRQASVWDLQWLSQVTRSELELSFPIQTRVRALICTAMGGVNRKSLCYWIRKNCIVKYLKVIYYSLDISRPFTEVMKHIRTTNFLNLRKFNFVSVCDTSKNMRIFFCFWPAEWIRVITQSFSSNLLQNCWNAFGTSQYFINCSSKFSAASVTPRYADIKISCKFVFQSFRRLIHICNTF